MSRRPARFPEAKAKRAGSLPPLLSLQQAADCLGLPKKTLRAHLHNGDIEFVALGMGKERRTIRLRQDDIATLKKQIEAGEVTGVPGFVYFAQMRDFVKIGYTKNVVARLAALQVGVPGGLTLAFSCPGSPTLEKRLHRQFAAERVNGEWFTFSDAIKAWIETHRCGEGAP